MRTLASLLVALLVIPACATASSVDRRAYILAHPHGWVELTIRDAAIPSIPTEEDSDEGWERPYSCSVSVRINNERFLWESAFPYGETEPYRMDTGFRFPVPVGEAAIELVYGDCRLAEGEVATLYLEASVVVEQDMTHELIFDGAALLVRDPTPNQVVTLEDVYEAITGRRSPAD